MSRTDARHAARTRRKGAFLLVLLFMLAGGPSNLVPSNLGPSNLAHAAVVVHFVKNGQGVGVYEPDTPWTRGDRYLEGTGKKAALLADHDLGGGSFEIRAVLSIGGLGETGAHFEFGGGKLTFDDADGMITIQGVPRNQKVSPLATTARHIQDGKPFELRISREGTRLRIWIDGSSIAELKVLKRPYGHFGFHPETARVRVVRFSASGSLLDVDRRVRIDPAELASLAQEERIDHAIESGIEFLLANIEGRQSPFGVANHPQDAAGGIALETFALIIAGIPLEHPVVDANFNHLNRQLIRKGRTYDLACFLFAHDAAIAQLEHDAMLTEKEIDPRALAAVGKRHRTQMKRGLETLLEGQVPGGAWRYDTNSKDFDHSCTQFAALGLGVAARRGLKIPDDVWIRLAQHLIENQQESGPETPLRATLGRERPEFTWSRAEREQREKREKRGKRRGGDDESGRGGTSVEEKRAPDPYVGDESIPIHARGWAYAKKATDSATWNMTCSGVSSLMITYSHGGHALDAKLRGEVSRGIRDGIGWLLEHWGPHANHYGLYSLEKVADIGGIDLFDDRDWYDEASVWLLDRQEKDGSWESNGTGEVPRISTAFALLILRRATTLLTRNPAEEIIVTGTGSDEEGADGNRVWIYVTRLDRAVSFPGLVRTLRLRPSVSLLRLLEEVCAEYPVDRVPEVIPSLLEVRGRVRGKGPIAAIDRCLALATGRSIDDPAEVRRWYETWVEIQALEHEKLGNPVARLEEIYAASAGESRILKVILPILIRMRAREALPTVIGDLDHRETAVRALVYRAVVSFHQETPPSFDPSASLAERRVQAAAVREWVAARAGARAPGASGG